MPILSFLKSVVKFFLYLLKSFFDKHIFIKKIGYEIINIGLNSSLIVALTGFFAGGVVCLQLYSGLSKFQATSQIPAILISTMLKELGPVLCGLMFCARVCSSAASEIATMKINENIKSLFSLNINPFSYIVKTKLIATFVTSPVLHLISVTMGVFGGALVCIQEFDMSRVGFINALYDNLLTRDLLIGLIKIIIFSISCITIASYKGMESEESSIGVSDATTLTVVYGSISILAINYFLSFIFLV